MSPLLRCWKRHERICLSPTMLEKAREDMNAREDKTSITELGEAIYKALDRSDFLSVRSIT
jgi:hypothetical protein